MSEYKMPGSNAAEFDMEEGLALALSYLEDPSDVPCPRCGPDKIEVVCYLDARSIEKVWSSRPHRSKTTPSFSTVTVVPGLRRWTSAAMKKSARPPKNKRRVGAPQSQRAHSRSGLSQIHPAKAFP